MHITWFICPPIRSVLAKLVNWAIHCGKIYISEGGNILLREVRPHILTKIQTFTVVWAFEGQCGTRSINRLTWISIRRALT